MIKKGTILMDNNMNEGVAAVFLVCLNIEKIGVIDSGLIYTLTIWASTRLGSYKKPS